MILFRGREESMARRCVVCDKGTVTGFSVAHSNKATKRRWYPNLQRVRIVLDGRTRRALVCTTCLKSGKVERAV